jgi:hypothetical protein
MKKVVIAIITLVGTLLCTHSSFAAYLIDGSVGDWGVNIVTTGIGADRKGYLNTHLPSGGRDIDYGTPEDNAGVYNESGTYIDGWQYVGPGSSYGNGTTDYLNKGNSFDAEGIYFDNDDTNAYIAVVMGLPKDGGTAPGNPWFFAGDIGIDVNRDGTYEFGIDVLDTHTKSADQKSGSATLYDALNEKAKLYSGLDATDWQGVHYSSFSAAGPWEIKNTATWDNDLIDFVYGGPWNTHYVLEAAIPLEWLGLKPGDQLNVHWTMECGNDYTTTLGDVNSPEPATLSLLGLGLVGLLGLKKKRA